MQSIVSPYTWLPSASVWSRRPHTVHNLQDCDLLSARLTSIEILLHIGDIILNHCGCLFFFNLRLKKHKQSLIFMKENIPDFLKGIVSELCIYSPLLPTSAWSAEGLHAHSQMGEKLIFKQLHECFSLTRRLNIMLAASSLQCLSVSLIIDLSGCWKFSRDGTSKQQHVPSLWLKLCLFRWISTLQSSVGCLNAPARLQLSFPYPFCFSRVPSTHHMATSPRSLLS